MAVDAYMAFQTYDGNWLSFESQADLSKNKEPLMTAAPAFPIGAGTVANTKQFLELEDYSFDIEQTLNIGSQSRGAGAGKITFNPFSITRKIDIASVKFFEMACSGTSFQLVQLGLRKSAGVGAVGQGGTEVTGLMFVRFDFKLVAVKTISWAHDDEAPKETVTFEYGGLQIRYSQQAASGMMQAPIVGGWNRVSNARDQGTAPIS